MGADYNDCFVVDVELKMTDTEINKRCQGIFMVCAHEFGHGGETGTLAEMLGKKVVVNKLVTFANKEQASGHIRRNLSTDKYGPAYAVPLINMGWVVGGWCLS